jgi:hypothetical protein
LFVASLHLHFGFVRLSSLCHGNLVSANQQLRQPLQRAQQNNSALISLDQACRRCSIVPTLLGWILLAQFGTSQLHALKMAYRGKKLDKGKGKMIESSSKDSLRSVVDLPNLDVSASTTSPTSSSNAPTSLDAFMGALGLGSTGPTESAYNDMQSADEGPVDLHSKRNVETPRYSKTKAVNSMQSAFGSSKMLHQVLGLNAPEPYVRPPPMPEDLERRFMAGLKQYGMDAELPETMSQAPEMNMMTAGNLGKTALDTIEEEELNLTKAADEGAGAGKVPSDWDSTPPTWNSGYEAVAGSEHTFAGIEENIEANAGDDDSLYDENAPYPADWLWTAHHGEGASETGVEGDYYPYDSYTEYASTVSLAESQPSRPSSAYEVDTTSHATASALSPYTNYGTNYGGSGAGYQLPIRSSSLANLRQHMSLELLPESVYKDAHAGPPGSPSAGQHTGSNQTLLFPSPRVGKEQPWGTLPTSSGGHQDFVPKFIDHDPDVGPSSRMHFGNQPREVASMPEIVVEAPSPKKVAPSKKRSATSQGKAPAKVQPNDSTVGLPILAANQEMLWKVEFPGYTYALMTIMLKWSVSMQRLWVELWDPFLFSINPAFPYPISPPIAQDLVSVAFYDNSTTPHKEIRFIGPGDVAEITYHEVDVFAYPSNEHIGTQMISHKHALTAIKRSIGLDKEARETGQGRWAYIILKGHHTKDTPPHVMIAWPTTAMTDSSECIHTVYPDTAPAPRPHFARPSKRSMSMQNLAATLGFSKDMRATASCDDLPPLAKVGKKDGAWMLMRQVVKMEKAGRVPLIEGYRVDIKSWEGFLNAAGKGKGKVIMWRERE